MPIDSRLLDLLCCPSSRVPLRPLEGSSLARLNERIRSGEVRRIDGQLQQQAVQDALITIDGQRIYRIDEGIPVMLADEAIAASELQEPA